jgi:general secretion pathway protein K
MRDIPANSGSATILMMLIASVLVTVGLGFNWLVKEHIQASQGLKSKAEAILKARSAYDTIIYLVLTGQVSQREIILSGSQELSELKTLPLDGQEVKFSEDVYVRLQDSNGMLSLAAVNSGALERLIRKATGQNSASSQIDSFLDWIDPDHFVRVNGAEEFYYKGQGLPYTPRNYALQYQEEVALIKGFGQGLYGKIQHRLTMLPSTGFNPNTASDEVLMAYLDINEDSLKTLKDYMSKKPVSTNVELFALTGRQIDYNIEGIYFYPSLYMDVNVRVGQPRSLYNIRAGLDITPKLYSPYGVLSWREE